MTMHTFMSNVILALTWAVATGQFTMGNLAAGFVLGYFVLLFARRFIGSSSYFAKVPQVLRFAALYLWELVLANLRIAHDVVTPTHHMRPGVIAIPLDARSDAEITLLANLLSLTPGSMTLDISADRRVLYAHLMYIDDGDVERARKQIKDGLERRVLQVLR
jgi:multicomponent Na+:H+ antiporter subunit E